MVASRSLGRGEGAALRRERSSHPAMNWLNTPPLFKTILDLGVLFVTTEVPLLFGAVALYRRRWQRPSDAAKAPAVSELYR
jgi:hypothetical protein